MHESSRLPFPRSCQEEVKDLVKGDAILFSRETHRMLVNNTKIENDTFRGAIEAAFFGLRGIKLVKIITILTNNVANNTCTI